MRPRLTGSPAGALGSGVPLLLRWTWRILALTFRPPTKSCTGEIPPVPAPRSSRRPHTAAACEQPQAGRAVGMFGEKSGNHYRGVDKFPHWPSPRLSRSRSSRSRRSRFSVSSGRIGVPPSSTQIPCFLRIGRTLRQGRSVISASCSSISRESPGAKPRASRTCFGKTKRPARSIVIVAFTIPFYCEKYLSPRQQEAAGCGILEVRREDDGSGDSDAFIWVCAAQ